MKNKTIKIVLIIFLSLLVIALGSFLTIVLTNKNYKLGYLNLFSPKSSNQLVFNKQYDVVFNSINIKSKSSNINIKKSNDSKIRVNIYGEKDKVKVNNNDNHLDITTDEKSCVGFCFNTKLAKVEIFLPENYSGSIDIKNNYGDVNIDKFENLILNANLDSGDIKADSLLSGKIKNSYGDIKILGHSKKLDIEDDCGDLEIETVDQLKAINNYGNIKAKKVNKYLDIIDDCGDIKLDTINLNKNSKIHNNYGDIKIGTTNKIYINANTSFGNTKINNNYRKSDITLDIDNDCGDIIINN